MSGYGVPMNRQFLARYVSPWTLRRERELQQRIAAIRSRDGENCRRCRRPIRFDLPTGHDKGPRVLTIETRPAGEPETLDALCLCHVRCNSAGADQTDEVTERLRRKSEAALLSKSRRAKKRA